MSNWGPPNFGLRPVGILGASFGIYGIFTERAVSTRRRHIRLARTRISPQKILAGCCTSNSARPGVVITNTDLSFYEMVNAAQTSAIDGDVFSIQRPSIFSQLERGINKGHQQLAVICMNQPSNHLAGLITNDEPCQPHGAEPTGRLTLSYAQIHRTASKLALGLQKKGILAGSTILLAIDNGGESALFLWTCAILRLTLAAIPPIMLETSKKLELQGYLTLLVPQLVVVPDKNGISAVRDAAVSSRISQPLCVSLRDLEGSDMGLSLYQIADAGHGTVEDEELILKNARDDDPDRIHIVLFTSGTSAGLPKGCPLSVRSTVHILESQSWLITDQNCARVLQQAHISCAIAPQHMLQTWRVGGTIVLPEGPSFAIEHTMEALLTYRTTFIVLSPAMVHALAKILPTHPGATDSVRSVQVGGDAVTKQVLRNCTALFPTANVFINHGMSEGGGFFTWPFLDTNISELPYFGEICPTGRVAPGTSVRIWDMDRKETVPRGQAGRLCLHCESIIPGYLDGVGASSFHHEDDRIWFDTGDIALLTEDNLIYILGRGKDMIKRSGKIFMPVALENFIETYTGIQVSDINSLETLRMIDLTFRLIELSDCNSTSLIRPATFCSACQP